MLQLPFQVAFGNSLVSTAFRSTCRALHSLTGSTGSQHYEAELAISANPCCNSSRQQQANCSGHGVGGPGVGTPGVSADGAAWHSCYQQTRSAHTHRYTDTFFDRHHRVNEAIFSRSLRVLMPDGSSAVMNRKDALKAASEANLDLIEFLRTEADPPIAKLMDYAALRRMHREVRQAHIDEARRLAAVDEKQIISKGPSAAAAGPASPPSSPQKQQQQQQQQDAQGDADPTKQRATSRQKAPKVKEAIFSPKIAEHDLRYKVKRIKEWLHKGHRVSLSWEIDATDSPDAAERALDKLLASVADVCTPSRKARQSTLVTVMLLPRAAEHQQQQPLSGKQGKGKATAG